MRKTKGSRKLLREIRRRHIVDILLKETTFETLEATGRLCWKRETK